MFRWASEVRSNGLPHPASLSRRGYRPIARHPRWPTSVLMERAKAAHEPCWYGVRKGASGQWIGDRKQTTAWEIEHDETAEGGHGTQKPVACMAIPITNHAGDVYDPFLGSGTTLVAAEQLGRRGYGMELEPRYVAIALERLERLGVVGAQAA